MSTFNTEYTRMILDETTQIISQESEGHLLGVSGELSITTKSLIGALTCAQLVYYNAKDKETREMSLRVMEGIFEDYFIEYVAEDHETIH